MSTKKIPSKSKRILVVEDEAITAQDIKSILERLGYIVVDTLSLGEEAVKAAKKAKPDLIFMDVKLAGEMDGIEAAKAMKEFNIPIIYLTAYGDRETIERAKKTGPYGFIHKPFDLNDLRSAIEMAVYKHGAEQKLKAGEEGLRKRNMELERARDELQRKNKELEKFNQLSVGREIKMIELKKEIERLKNK